MHRSTLSFIFALAAAPMIVLAPACGGAQSIDFGGSGSGSGGGSGSSSGGVTAAPDSGSAAVDSGLPAFDTGSTVDVFEPADVTPVEEPPPASGPSVSCPMNGAPATCNPGDYCCVAGSAMQGNQTDACQHSGTTCSGGTPVRCSSAADCSSGQVCCGTETTNPQTMMVSYTEVGCAATCTGTAQRIFCDPADTGACPTATPVCGQSQLLPGYTVCQQ